MKRFVKCTQPNKRLLSISVDGTGTASIDGGDKLHAALTDNGTGNYTLTFTHAFAKTPQAYFTPLVADVQPQITAISTTALTVEFSNNSGTATDTEFHVLVIGDDDDGVF